MHVPLDSSEHDPRLFHLRLSAPLLNVRLQQSHRILHSLGRLYHLRQEHLSRPEQFPDPSHPAHQRPVNDLHRFIVQGQALIDVPLQSRRIPFDQRPDQPLLHSRFGRLSDHRSARAVTNCRIAICGRYITRICTCRLRVGKGEATLYPDRARSVGRLCPFRPGTDPNSILFHHNPRSLLNQPIRSLGIRIQNHILHTLKQPRLNLIINPQHPRIHNPHIKPRRNSMVKKHRMHGFTYSIVPTERKRKIGNTT